MKLWLLGSLPSIQFPPRMGWKGWAFDPGEAAEVTPVDQLHLQEVSLRGLVPSA